jgi:hypothetical protein
MSFWAGEGGGSEHHAALAKSFLWLSLFISGYLFPDLSLSLSVSQVKRSSASAVVIDGGTEVQAPTHILFDS